MCSLNLMKTLWSCPQEFGLHLSSGTVMQGKSREVSLSIPTQLKQELIQVIIILIIFLDPNNPRKLSDDKKFFIEFEIDMIGIFIAKVLDNGAFPDKF